jgi:hypothetical protein
MAPIYSPYFDPDWCATVHVVPFDPEEDRRREVEAVLDSWERDNEEAKNAARGILGGLAFSVLLFAAIFAWCCL